MSLENLLWKQVKETLQQKNPSQLLKSALDKTTLKKETSGGKSIFTLNVPSLFLQNFIRSFLPEIQLQIKKQDSEFSSLQIKTNPLLFPQKTSSSSFFQKKHSSQTKKRRKHQEFSPFFSEFTFSSFVSGPSNHFALATAKNIAENPLKNRSNPFFLHGASGLGKTHILLAVGNAIKKRKPELKVQYLSTEQFFNEYICHLRKNDMVSFRTKYRKNISVLILDDCQMLGRGESIQDEFFHTFESLIQSGCQIMLASDVPPKEIKGLKDRIKTRFNGGIVTNIKSPDQETKMAIAKCYCKKLNLFLSEEILSYITKIGKDSSIRELIGGLKIIKMFCELQNKEVSFSLVQKLLPSKLPPQTPSSKIKHLKEEICNFFEITPSELNSKSRRKHIVYARHLAMFLAKELFKLSYWEIGHQFGGKDHSGVIYAIKKVRKLSKTKSSIKKDLEALCRKLPIRTL